MQALGFTILTAARSGETMGALWSEIEEEGRLWRVPALRMKGNREHVVPLSDEAWAIIDRMRGRSEKYVFPGASAETLSVMALAMALRRAGGGNFTTHGFRSSFRDWCGDATSFQQADVETCLAHTVGNATERAYRRGNALEKRREIMDAWARYLSCEGTDNLTRPPAAP
jgi:integrase